MGAGRDRLAAGAAAPVRLRSRMLPVSAGTGGVPFLVPRSSRSIAISSRRVWRSLSMSVEHGMSSL